MGLFNKEVKETGFKRSPLNISILGSRGVPGNYGGFETCAEELGVRLVQRGHNVAVYCCAPYSQNDDPYYNGIKRITLPTIRAKALEKLFFAVLSIIHVCFTKTDVILMLGVSASVFSFIPRIFGIKVIINVDGLEWRRKKWGKIASLYLRFSERSACYTTNLVVTDALCVKDYYLKAYGQITTFIPYGIRTAHVSSDQTLKKLGLKPGEYILYVSRFEPENNPLLVRRAFERVKTDKRLVMLGSAPFPDEYVKQIHQYTDKRVMLPGAIYGSGYVELQANAYAYIQATEVGGIHPALVEAVGFGNCIIANDVPEHREVLGDAGIYYNGTDEELADKLQYVLDRPEFVKERRSFTKNLAGLYSWDNVCHDYESLFYSLI